MRFKLKTRHITHWWPGPWGLQVIWIYQKIEEHISFCHGGEVLGDRFSIFLSSWSTERPAQHHTDLSIGVQLFDGALLIMMTRHCQSWPAIVNHNPPKQEKLVQHCVDFLFPKFSSSQSIGGRLNGICILLQRTHTNKMIVKTARYYEEETRIFQGATSVNQAGQRSKPVP